MARPTPVSGFVLRANRRSPAPAGGLFVAFTLLVGTSLAAIGVAVLVGGSLPAFAGWFVILIGTVVVGGYLGFGDMPPFVSYLPAGLLGIVLVLATR